RIAGSSQTLNLAESAARSGGPLGRRHDAFPAQPIRPNAGSAWRNFLHVDAVVSQDSVQYETRMNLMREQYFRRNCAQHTISIASALFGECRTRGERRIRRTLRPHRAHAGVVSRGVCGNAHLLLCLRMGTVTAFLHIMLGGCKEERPVAEAPTPLGVQRIAVAASPAEGWCHEDVLDTGCHPDIPPWRRVRIRASRGSSPSTPTIIGRQAAFARVLWPRGSSSRLRRCLCSARRSCDCAIDTSPIGSSKVAWRRPKRCPRSLQKSSIKSALDRVITG